MIRVKIMGGLGNQLFQYAFAKSIQSEYGFEVELDKSWYQSMGEATPREFLLDKLNCIINYTPTNDVYRCKDVVNENDMREILIKDDTYYVGYWQNPRYFTNIKKQLIEDFRIKDVEIINKAKNFEESIKNNESVSLHVRRGDYIKYTNHPICELTYYRDAINILKEKYSNLSFYIFSDDLDWCKESFSFLGKNSYFVNTGDDLSDWYLMIETKHHIIANSTYSWWAAWLGNSNGEVIMPKKWLYPDNHDELRCEGWIWI